MKPVQIRRPLIRALKKLGVDISIVPENLIREYIRRIKKVLNENIDIWIERKLYKTHDLNTMAMNLVHNNIDTYAAMLKRTLYEDVLAA